MIPLPPDFKEFLKLLNSNEVEYLVLGGYAVGHHGFPRATVDFDVWVRRTHDNARRVASAVSEFGFADAGASEELFSAENQIVRMGVPPLRIEVITTASGVSFE